MRAANASIKAHCEADELLTYVDVDAPMIGDDGMPDPTLFIDDGLHLNAKGYALWASILAPLLAEASGDER
jgi:lysophospholipase L1-like esterase